MRCLLTTALLVLAAPAFSQENEAEKLYRAMEKKVQSAKSLKIVWETEMQDGGKGGKSEKVKGVGYVAEGNKVRFEIEGTFAGISLKSLLVSDGKQMDFKQTVDGKKENPDAKPKAAQTRLNISALAILTRFGALQSSSWIAFSDPNAFDAIDKKLPVSEFKLGPKEIIGKQEAQVVEFKLEMGAEEMKVKFWIDAKTMLPLKRSTVMEGKKEMSMIETYTEFILEPKVDVKLFELPK